MNCYIVCVRACVCVIIVYCDPFVVMCIVVIIWARLAFVLVQTTDVCIRRFRTKR